MPLIDFTDSLVIMDVLSLAWLCILHLCPLAQYKISGFILSECQINMELITRRSVQSYIGCSNNSTRSREGVFSQRDSTNTRRVTRSTDRGVRIQQLLLFRNPRGPGSCATAGRMLRPYARLRLASLTLRNQ
jgi:hypothetical protein